MKDLKIREELIELYIKREDAIGRSDELRQAIYGRKEESDYRGYRGDLPERLTIKDLKESGNRYVHTRLEFEKRIEKEAEKYESIDNKIDALWEVLKIEEDLERKSESYRRSPQQEQKKRSLWDSRKKLEHERQKARYRLWGNTPNCNNILNGGIAHEYDEQIRELKTAERVAREDVTTFIKVNEEKLVERYLPKIDIVQHLLTEEKCLHSPGLRGEYTYPDLSEVINESR